MRAWPILALVLVGCGSHSTPPPPPSEWYNYNGKTTIPLTSSFPLAVEPHYVYKKPPPLALGQTVTLNYTVSPDATFVVADPSDVLPATIHLFLWEAGDNLSGAGPYEFYRWWCPTGASLAPGTGTLSCVFDNTWTSVHGKTGDMTGALANPQGIGFTFGGQYFYGHGVRGNGTFTINSFGVQ